MTGGLYDTLSAAVGGGLYDTLSAAVGGWVVDGSGGGGVGVGTSPTEPHLRVSGAGIRERAMQECAEACGEACGGGGAGSKKRRQGRSVR